MLKIGITGGIGSGKTFVAQIFEKLHISVYFSDKEARRLMNENSEIQEKLLKLLGKESYDMEGHLNKKYLADRIFRDKDLIQKVNSIVHPVVRQDFNQWAEEQESKYVLQESAILFEIGADKLVDKMIIVTAPVELRIRRVMQRDQISKEAVLQRMKNQWKQDKKQKLADFIIRNTEEEMLMPQIIKLHNYLLSLIN